MRRPNAFTPSSRTITTAIRGSCRQRSATWWSSKAAAQALYNRLWSAGFLPSKYQGVALRAKGDPVLFLSNPAGVDAATRRRALDAINRLNHREYESIADPETQARIAQYEMAFRMQASVPELTDLAKKNAIGEYWGDRMLLTNLSAGLSTEPDGTFATWETLRDGRLYARGASDDKGPMHIPIKVADEGLVLLGDVASVHDGYAVQQNVVRVNGERAT